MPMYNIHITLKAPAVATLCSEGSCRCTLACEGGATGAQTQ